MLKVSLISYYGPCACYSSFFLHPRGYMNCLFFLPLSLISDNAMIWQTEFCDSKSCLLVWLRVRFVSDLWACKWGCLFGEMCCLCPVGPWSGDWRLSGCESVPNCWHRHGVGRDSQSKMGRWPSQVLTLTDEIKEKVGQAKQVSGKQTPRDRVRETNTPQSQTELGEWKVAA